MRLDPLLGPDGSPLSHVHAVRSRRLEGVALELDLSPAGVCNWRCSYCAVADLSEGAAPDFELELVTSELEAGRAALRAAHGAEPLALLISGSGEPTTLFEFHLAVERALAATEGLKPVLVSNGSQLNKPKVRGALEAIAAAGGELWAKLDSATREGHEAVNHSGMILRQVRENLRVGAKLCPTWVQTTLFVGAGEHGGVLASEAERDAWLSMLKNQVAARIPLAGVQLVALDRDSAQADAAALAAPERAAMDALADEVTALGLECRVIV